MYTNDLTKALDSASQILKGTWPAGVTATQLEDAMLKHAESNQRDGESGGQALVRMLDNRDEVVMKLSDALDVLRTAEQQQPPPDPGAVLVKRAEALIDDYVQQNTRTDETPEQAYSRLAAGDPTFAELYQHLTEARDLATG